MHRKRFAAERIIAKLREAAVAGPARRPLCLKDGDAVVFGKNFDFALGQGQVHVNQRGLRKTALIAPPEKPLTWVAVYGSISFNQNGREFPCGGMNEAGLVIEMMMHENEEAVYPALDERHGLEELQWIQYQLDMSASVADVVASDAVVRISRASIAPPHFLVSDARGNVAAIEYVDGAMAVHAGTDLKCAALANNTYSLSLEYKTGLDSGAAQPEEGIASSFSRFARAAAMAGAYDRAHGSPVDCAFSVLDSVSSRATQWNIVYDSRNKTIHYRTRANRAIRGIAVSMFDFSCSSRRLFADIEKDISGRSDFETYDPEVNLKLIDTVWSSVSFLQPLPRETRIAFASYPDSVVCDGGE